MALNHYKFLLWMLLVQALAGCGGLPSAPPGGVPVEERPGPETAHAPAAAPGGPQSRGEALERRAAAPQPAREPPAAGAAALALLTEAGTEARAGNTDRADALLERALRIEPRNPLLWHRLALLRLQQGEYDQTVAFASKSNTLAAEREQLLAANWRLIAQAKALLGDREGARAARIQAEQHGADAD